MGAKLAVAGLPERCASSVRQEVETPRRSLRELQDVVANQLCLQLSEFWRLVDCSLSELDWVAVVRRRCPNGTNPFMRRGS